MVDTSQADIQIKRVVPASTSPRIASRAKKRSIRACAHCHVRKVRCNVDHGIPCYNCVTDQVKCKVPEKRPRLGWKKPAESTTKQLLYHSELKTEDRIETPASQDMFCQIDHHDQTATKHVRQSSGRELGTQSFRIKFAKWLCACPLQCDNELYNHLKLISQFEGDQPHSKIQSYALAMFQAFLLSLQDELLSMSQDDEQALSLLLKDDSTAAMYDSTLAAGRRVLAESILRLQKRQYASHLLQRWNEAGSYAGDVQSTSTGADEIQLDCTPASSITSLLEPEQPAFESTYNSDNDSAFLRDHIDADCVALRDIEALQENAVHSAIAIPQLWGSDLDSNSDGRIEEPSGNEFNAIGHSPANNSFPSFQDLL